MALMLCLLLSLFWGQGCPFELQEAIQELHTENTQLRGKIQNLTDALSQLQVLVWNQSQGSAVEHLHRERPQCRPNAHWRNTAAPAILVPSVIWLLVLMSLTAMLTKG